MKELKEVHKDIVEAYLRNGQNGTAAVQEIKPELTYNSASVTWSTLAARKDVKQYLKEKKARLRAEAEVNESQVVRELLSIAYNDPTQYMELSPTELKQLPPEAKRAIQSYSIKESTDKHGNVTGTTVTVKLQDKLKALEMLAKYIGLFEADNKQKAAPINIEYLDARTLNILEQAAKKANEVEE